MTAGSNPTWYLNMCGMVVAKVRIVMLQASFQTAWHIAH